MRVLIVAASLVALASAFTTHQPRVAAPRIGVADEQSNNAHRNRRATIVADGKANGTSACLGLFCCCGVSQSSRSIGNC